MLNFIGKCITKIARFLSENIIGVIVIEFVLLFIFWTVGYFSNAIWNMHYDLQSCWSGIMAIFGTAVMGGLQKILEYAKYKTDSKYNSPNNTAPGAVKESE